MVVYTFVFMSVNKRNYDKFWILYTILDTLVCIHSVCVYHNTINQFLCTTAIKCITRLFWNYHYV